MTYLRRLFLNDHLIMAVIVINAITIFLQTYDYAWPWLT